LIAQFVLALDHGFHLCFDFRQAALQGPDVLQEAASDPLVLCRSQPVLFRDDHGDDITPVCGKVRQTPAFGRARECWNQLERSPHLGQNPRIDAVILG